MIHGSVNSMVSMMSMWDYGEWGVKVVKNLILEFIVQPQGNFALFCICMIVVEKR